ncbi:MAG: FHA domain-containing protein [Candidatus Abyssobacteria bacterium SURF_5]|uniref:FHA domain-containing protein n=1 Tax=Abyssobacteria bacterium (strain SURF_5) TaxID=2093360 RepID=A0A3A4NK74_ABYX5|nr:MAG: FHA domain-containing protein [Candidatus Abyssubacteria bacterium SURF_5]
MAILTLVFGRDILGTFDVNRNKMIIGRADDCDIVIDNLAVSRHHAIIEKNDGSVLINDLDSNNGTFINGQKIIGSTALNFGDEIGIGKHVLVFDSHAKKRKPLDAPIKEALPDMDSPERGTMLVEPKSMEKIQKKVSASRKAHLRLKNGHNDVLIRLDKADLFFGKASECDVKIGGFFCSRKHAAIKRVENGYQVINFAVLSPTRLNGTRVQSAFLCDGDEIKMGGNTFLFHSDQ